MKRRPVQVNMKVGNYSEHFTQLNFKGIIESDNPFEADQRAFADCNNVFVDESSVLVSRPPIVESKLPDVFEEELSITTPVDLFPDGYKLVDIYQSGTVTIWIGQNDENLYYVRAMLNETHMVIEPDAYYTDYEVVIYENYIIVFNDVDAVFLDVDKFSDGWQLLREHAEIPTTKRFVGQEVFTESGNQFTNAYKEEYVWSDDILQLLPDGDAVVKVNQLPEPLEWRVEDANQNTEFRILRRLNYKLAYNDIVTMSNSDGIRVICISSDKFLMLSFDDGDTFSRVLYPTMGNLMNISSISDDGLYAFVVADDGVHRYSIADEEWVVFKLSTGDNLKGICYDNQCHFANSDLFGFVCHENIDNVSHTYAYSFGGEMEGCADGYLLETEITDLITSEIDSNLTYVDSHSRGVRMSIAENVVEPTAVMTFIVNSSAANMFLLNIVGQGNAVSVLIHQIDTEAQYMALINTTAYIDYDIGAPHLLFTGVLVEAVMDKNSNWVRATGYIGDNDGTVEVNTTEDFVNIIDGGVGEGIGIPLPLVTAYLYNDQIISIDSVNSLPSELISEDRTILWGDRRNSSTANTNFLININGEIYTNIIDGITSSLIYTYDDNEPFTEIPNAWYADSEIYLGFNDVLKITQNSRDEDGGRLFVLPAINNQTFTSPINGIINLSTTHVGIFLKDSIHVVYKVADDVFGYRYDYARTKLSIGLAPGDDLMNSSNGVHTFYPTDKGFAAMFYQPDVAATDQIVEYISEPINLLWKSFYKSGGPVSITEYNDFIIITNESKTYLMFDLRNKSWWKFDSPINVLKMSTDHINLRILSNGYYEFNNNVAQYKDVNDTDIEWYMKSHPLHFGLPAHYKNLKQFIFNVAKSSNNPLSISTQIAIYRNDLLIREPELVEFKIDEYNTFVKRYNSWKVNMVRWMLSSDLDVGAPSQLRLIGLNIKYQRGEEVR